MSRQLYWKGKDKLQQFEWFIKGEQISYQQLCQKNLISKGDDISKLEICLNVLKSKGESYYPVVYYPENEVQQKIGFYVAQVYIPKAFPFYLVEKYGTFDSDRLQEFAESKKVFNWELNPQPHMFS